MIKGKTTSGFEYEVDEDMVKDYEFITESAELSQCEDGEDDAEAVILLHKMIVRVLGKKGEKKLIKHVMRGGVADFERVNSEFSEILSAMTEQDKDVKN